MPRQGQRMNGSKALRRCLRADAKTSDQLCESIISLKIHRLDVTARLRVQRTYFGLACGLRVGMSALIHGWLWCLSRQKAACIHGRGVVAEFECCTQRQGVASSVYNCAPLQVWSLLPVCGIVRLRVCCSACICFIQVVLS